MRISDWSSDVCSSDLAEPFGGHFGVPLVAAVAEIVDAAQVDQHLEAEFVAQRAAAVVPGVGREHDAHLAARHRHVDLGAFTPCTQIGSASGMERVCQYV